MMMAKGVVRVDLQFVSTNSKLFDSFALFLLDTIYLFAFFLLSLCICVSRSFCFWFLADDSSSFIFRVPFYTFR